MQNPRAPFAVKPVLTGSLVELRPFTDDDVERMAPILAEPEVLRLTGSVHHSDEHRSPELDDATRDWYRGLADRPERLDLAIVDRATGRCVGESVLNEWDADDLSCNFRILLGAEGRGRGLGTEAVRLTLAHAFAATPVHRIELGVYAFNPRAIRTYERAGFRLEGRRRDAFRFDGEPVDELLMSVLRTDGREQG